MTVDDLGESVHGRRGGRGPQRRGGEGGNRLSPARPQRGRAGERRFGRIFLSEIPSFGRRERPGRGRGQRQGGSAHRRDGDGLAGPLGMGHVTGRGAWRGCGDAGGVGGVLSGRLARGKSFFQKTLEAARGVFWRGLGRVGGWRKAASGGLGCGAVVQRFGGGEGRVGAERRGAQGRVIAPCQGSSRGPRRTQGKARRRDRRERWEGEHVLQEAHKELEEVRREVDDGHSGLGCGTYTNSVHYVSARGKVGQTGVRGAEAVDSVSGYVVMGDLFRRREEAAAVGWVAAGWASVLWVAGP